MVGIVGIRTRVHPARGIVYRDHQVPLPVPEPTRASRRPGAASAPPWACAAATCDDAPGDAPASPAPPPGAGSSPRSRTASPPCVSWYRSQKCCQRPPKIGHFWPLKIAPGIFRSASWAAMRLPARGRLHWRSPVIRAYAARGTVFDFHDGRNRRPPDPAGPSGLAHRCYGPVRPRSQGRQVWPFPLKPVRRALLQRAVDPDVGLTVEPSKHPGVKIVVGDEVPAVEEALADVADRPLHLAPASAPGRGGTPGSRSPSDG